MANPEHLAWLHEGVDAWNARWKALYAEVGRKADPSETRQPVEELPAAASETVQNIDRRQSHRESWSTLGIETKTAPRIVDPRPYVGPSNRSSFSEAYLIGAHLPQADLSGADLREASLSGALLDGALLNGARLTKANLQHASLLRADLNGANLQGTDLSGAALVSTSLLGADLSQAILSGAKLMGAALQTAHLPQADLSGADLSGARLTKANLVGANLQRAILHGARLSEANLSRANLSQADLQRAMFVETDLRGANLSGCHVYGISAWDLQLEGTIQDNLVITPDDEPEISVDNLEVAQFVYLLLATTKIRNVIDTLTTKAVLILGRFTDERKTVLDALRDALRRRGYVPILFDFEKPASRDLTETVSTLAHLARFVVADLTDAKSLPQELSYIVPDLPSVPVQPLILEGQHEYAMFEHFARFPWVLPPYAYADQSALIAGLVDHVITPAEAKAGELVPPQRRAG